MVVEGVVSGDSIVASFLYFLLVDLILTLPWFKVSAYDSCERAFYISNGVGDSVIVLIEPYVMRPQDVLIEPCTDEILWAPLEQP